MKLKVWILFLILIAAISMYPYSKSPKHAPLSSDVSRAAPPSPVPTNRIPASPLTPSPQAAATPSKTFDLSIVHNEVTRLLEKDGRRVAIPDPFLSEKELSRQILPSPGGFEYRARLMKLDGIPYNVFIFDKIEKSGNQIQAHAGIVAQYLKIKAEDGTTAEQIQSLVKSLGYELGDFDFLPNYYLVMLPESSLEGLEKAYKALSQSSLIKSVSFDHLSIL